MLKLFSTEFITSSELHDVSVVVKPILAISNDKQVKEGSNVTFSCNITAANPSTRVTWKSPTNALIQHSNGVVMMNYVSPKQGGRYSCHATNSAGESTKTFTLTVGEYISYIHIFIFNSFKEGCPSTSWFSRGPPIKTLVTI